MKADELRDLSEGELREHLATARRELFGLRFQRATGRIESPAKMRQVRREIARIKTLLNEKARA